MTTAAPKRNRDGSPPTAMSVPGELCGHCIKKCTTKGKTSEAIQCDVCFEWVHATCEGFSKDQYKTFNQLVTAFPNITYCCKLLLLLLLLLLLATMTYNQVQSLRINHQRISFSR